MRRKRKQAKQNQGRQLITQVNPRSSISEQYRTVRTNLQFTSVDREIQTMIVTSATQSEGKSITAANLAVVYAQQGKKVLLVDADLRKPTIHYTFRMNNVSGLSNLLVNEASLTEAIFRSEVDNLDVISSGPVPPNPSELLGSSRMQTIIEEASALYEVIIFDTPPILVVTDAQILANYVDGSLLVIRSKHTEQEEAIKAKEALTSARAKLLGAVLNDQEKASRSNYYYYGTE